MDKDEDNLAERGLLELLPRLEKMLDSIGPNTPQSHQDIVMLRFEAICEISVQTRDRYPAVWKRLVDMLTQEGVELALKSAIIRYTSMANGQVPRYGILMYYINEAKNGNPDRHKTLVTLFRALLLRQKIIPLELKTYIDTVLDDGLFDIPSIKSTKRRIKHEDAYLRVRELMSEGKSYLDSVTDTADGINKSASTVKNYYAEIKNLIKNREYSAPSNDWGSHAKKK